MSVIVAGAGWSGYSDRHVVVQTFPRRPQLRLALEQARAAGATLLIAKLDRLSRSVAFISALLDGSVEVRACDMPTANRFVMHVMAAVAEEEGRAISERTKKVP